MDRTGRAQERTEVLTLEWERQFRLDGMERLKRRLITIEPKTSSTSGYGQVFKSSWACEGTQIRNQRAGLCE